MNGEETFDLPSKDLPTGYLENFYTFHKNKRKKNFDLKHLHESQDLLKGGINKQNSISASLDNSSILEKPHLEIKEENKGDEAK